MCDAFFVHLRSFLPSNTQWQGRVTTIEDLAAVNGIFVSIKIKKLKIYFCIILTFNKG
jgi:hypothetical protein